MTVRLGFLHVCTVISPTFPLVLNLYHLLSIHVLISSRLYLHGKCAFKAQPLVTSRVQHRGSSSHGKHAYSCSPHGTSSHHRSGADAPFSGPCECLPPGWLLGLPDHSWGHLSRLSSHYFSSTSCCLPITAQLNERCSKLCPFRGWCLDCE